MWRNNNIDIFPENDENTLYLRGDYYHSFSYIFDNIKKHFDIEDLNLDNFTICCDKVRNIVITRKVK